MAKNSVLIYTDWIEQIEYLSMEERGILLTAILHYQAGMPLPEMDKILSLIFIPIRQQLDRDNEAYIKKCEKNKANIEARWKRSQSESIRNDTNVYDGIRNDTKNTDNDKDNGNGKGNDNDKDNGKDNGNGKGNDNDKEEAPTPTPSRINEVISAWNSIPHTVAIDDIIPMTRRYDELRICLNMVGFNGVMKAIDKVKNSEYLKNHGGIVFDRYINRNAIQNLLEGGYDKDFSKPKTAKEQHEEYLKMWEEA